MSARNSHATQAANRSTQRSQSAEDEGHTPGRPGRGGELRHCFSEGESNLHGALGVVFVRLRIAEIDEYAVAHVLGDNTVVLFDSRGAAAMVGSDAGSDRQQNSVAAPV